MSTVQLSKKPVVHFSTDNAIKLQFIFVGGPEMAPVCCVAKSTVPQGSHVGTDTRGYTI